MTLLDERLNRKEAQWPDQLEQLARQLDVTHTIVSGGRDGRGAPQVLGPYALEQADPDATPPTRQVRLTYSVVAADHRTTHVNAFSLPDLDESSALVRHGRTGEQGPPWLEIRTRHENPLIERLIYVDDYVDPVETEPNPEAARSNRLSIPIPAERAPDVVAAWRSLIRAARVA